MIKMLSDNFSYDEAITSEIGSRKGIDNTPNTDTLLVMQKTAIKLEKVRALLGFPIHVNSWYRCPTLNLAVGSHSSSQHIKGEAVDIICSQFGSPLDMCKRIIEYKDIIQFDQLILEHTWVHISFAILSGSPRNQVLSLLKNGTYAVGLTDMNGKPL